eukprot:6180335-Pleurochrysis_carterae.AAC.2
MREVGMLICRLTLLTSQQARLKGKSSNARSKKQKKSRAARAAFAPMPARACASHFLRMRVCTHLTELGRCARSGAYLPQCVRAQMLASLCM